MIILSILWMGFAWAVSGEHFFGRWRRGAMLFPAVAIVGYLHAMPWYYYVMQAVMAWAVYQALFYDDCIRMVYGSYPTLKSKVLGHAGLFVNGVLIGLSPALLWLFEGNWVKAALAVTICGAGLAFVCIGSNVWGWRLPGVYRIKGDNGKQLWDPDYESWHVTLWGGQDPWWLSELCMGFILGGCFL